MLDEILPPFEFTVEFLLLVVAWGSAIEAMRARPRASRLRAITAFGFVLVGAAQFLLGLRILGPEAATTASLIRGTGYLFIAAGLVRMPAFGRVAVFLPLAVLPANAPLASAGLAFLVAIRGATIHARDQRPDSFSFASAFVFLGAGEALLVLEGDGWSVARLAAQGLGSFLLAGWLFGRFTSIRIRFVTRAIVSLVAGLLFLAAGFNVVISRTLTEETRNRLADAAAGRVQLFDDLEDRAVAKAATLARGFAAGIEGVENAQPPQETAVSDGFMPLLDPADFIVVIDRSERVVASAELVLVEESGEQRPRGRPLRRSQTVPIQGSPMIEEAIQTAVEASRIQRVSYQSEDGVTINELNVLGVAPVFSTTRPGTTIGAIVVGFRIDDEQIGQLARDTGTVSALRVAGDLVVIRGPGGGPTELEDPLRAQLENVLPGPSEGEPVGSTIDITVGPQRFIVVETPIVQNGAQLASLLLITSPDALAGVLQGLTRVLFFLLIIALVVAGLYALRAGRRVTQPIVALTEASLALRAGDLSARAEVAGDDEIRTLSAAFNAMAIDLEAATKDLKSSADAESALRGRLEAIVQSMGDALIAVDPHGRVTTMNRAAERLLDVDVDAAEGESLAQIVDGTSDDGQSLAAAVSEEISGAGMLRRGRTQRLVAFESRPLSGPDGSAGRVVVIRDETETRQAERMKDEFLANVSHELRTPLTPIRGFADILSRKDVPREKSTEYLRKILESSLRLERIVDILVDFAAIEAGRMPVRSEVLPVAELIRERGREWSELEPDRSVRTRVQRGVGRMLGDPAIVVRVLDELIDNAMKFSDGPVMIAAERAGTARSPLVRITVGDRGPGIPDERLGDIFRGFQQGDGGETREIGGLGLGLAFVKRAIEHIGGSVDLASAVGRGTEVSILLPEAPAATSRGTRKRKRAVSPRGAEASRARSA